MDSPNLSTDYAGRRAPLFRLAMVTGLRTVLTLGIYRFWMKTRLRRYYWSAIRPGGHPLEYLGTPSEKLLGFLLAVVIMAFYIGLVNLALLFLSFGVFGGHPATYAFSFVGLVPIIFYAQYRARRYILARTRWRGIRFGMSPGAWGYCWRAILYWVLTMVTLGLLWPLKTFALEKYRTDRTWFGDHRMQQGGRWVMLIGAMKHVYVSVLVIIALIVATVLAETERLIPLIGVSTLWTTFGLAHWRAESFRRLTSHKSLIGPDGEAPGPIRLTSQARTGQVVAVYLLGWLWIYLIFMAVFFVLGLLIAAAIFALSDAVDVDTIANAADPFAAAGPVGWAIGAVGLLIYFGVFLLGAALTQAFITLPLARHFAETLTISGADALGRVHQRARDEFDEAEGFADALDVGAAI